MVSETVPPGLFAFTNIRYAFSFKPEKPKLRTQSTTFR
jgi:hypothetical protein